MFKKLKDDITAHIENNRNSYFFLLLTFVLGVSAGAFTVNGLSVIQRDELNNYFQGFLQLLNNQTIEGSELFSYGLVENMKLVGLLWLLGLTIIGIPFIFLIISVKGFIIGFSSGFIINALGIKGLLFSAFSLLPKEIIIVPCLIAIGVNGIRFSIYIARRKSTNEISKGIKTSFISNCLVTVLFTCIILVGIALDAYVTPVMVRIIAPIFTQ